jgi:hypothetical protein
MERWRFAYRRVACVNRVRKRINCMRKGARRNSQQGVNDLALKTDMSFINISGTVLVPTTSPKGAQNDPDPFPSCSLLDETTLSINCDVLADLRLWLLLQEGRLLVSNKGIRFTVKFGYTQLIPLRVQLPQ